MTKVVLLLISLFMVLLGLAASYLQLESPSIEAEVPIIASSKDEALFRFVLTDKSIGTGNYELVFIAINDNDVDDNVISALEKDYPMVRKLSRYYTSYLNAKNANKTKLGIVAYSSPNRVYDKALIRVGWFEYTDRPQWLYCRISQNGKNGWLATRSRLRFEEGNRANAY